MKKRENCGDQQLVMHPRVRPTIGAVFVLGPIDGAVRLHLQLEALATGKSGHNAL